MELKRFQKWAEREYSAKRRIIALIFESILFVIVIPFFLAMISHFLDQWLQLPRFVHGLVNPLLSLLLIVPGWFFALWSIQVQFALGCGTPSPLMATQQLVVQGPYAYCRNPMTLGNVLAYLGIGIWIGSLSAVGLVLLFAALFGAYIKFIEERELEMRFGSKYLEYKRSTPFLVPRLRKRG